VVKAANMSFRSGTAGGQDSLIMSVPWLLVRWGLADVMSWGRKRRIRSYYALRGTRVPTPRSLGEAQEIL
jgi:hypothetical protein